MVVEYATCGAHDPALLEMGIPVTLYTGYDASNLPEKYAHVPVVTKPRDCAEALDLLSRQMAAT